MKQSSTGHFFALLVFLACSPLTSQGYSFDVKVPKSEMADLAPIANGFSYFLITSGHSIAEAGEDYALWLSDYRKIIRGTAATVGFILELTEASGFRKGRKLSSLPVEFEYTIPAAETITTDEPVFRFMRKKFTRMSASVALEAKEGGKAAELALPALLEAGRVKPP